MKTSMIAISMLLFVCCAARAEDESAAPPTRRMLFVGNSFTYFFGMPTIVARLGAADAEPIPIEVSQLVGGNRTMQDFWDNGEFLQRLEQGPWDVVVLQKWQTREHQQLAWRVVRNPLQAASVPATRAAETETQPCEN